MAEVPGYSKLTTSEDQCLLCGDVVTRRGLARARHYEKAHPSETPSAVAAKVEAEKDDPLRDLQSLLGTPMSKEEAMIHASDLIRDPSVQANQKGPLLSSLARVAGWETAPEYDFEKERGKWMANFEKMKESKEALEAGMKGVLKKYRESIPALEAMVKEARG